MKFNNLKINIILFFLFSLLILLLNNNDIMNTHFFIESKIFYRFILFNLLISMLIYYLVYKIYLFYLFYLYMFFLLFFFFLLIALIFYILKELKLIKFIVLFLLIYFSQNIFFLSSETDFPGSGGGNGLNGAITLVIILLGGAIGMVYQLHKISKIPPKFSTFKPKTEGIEPTPSKFFDAKDESVPEILKLADRISRGELNLPKPPQIPIRTPFEKALDDFCVQLAIFTAFLFLLYTFYSRDVLGFREYILHVKSKINKKTIFWRYRFYIILTFQFIATILILFL